MLNALEVAKNNFSYSKPIKTIWEPDPADMDAVHQELRTRFDKAITNLAERSDGNSPLGWVVTGPAGSGKTHLLSSFCQQTRAMGGIFLLVDMTTVTDFWEKVRFDFVDSILPTPGNQKFQGMQILEKVVAVSQTGVGTDMISELSRKELPATMNIVLGGLFRQYGKDVQNYRNIILAAFMLGSKEFDIVSAGSQWLRGELSDSTEYKRYGFTQSPLSADETVKGLSWLTSLGGGFSVMALDQFDGIVKQYYLPGVDLDHDTNRTAKQIILGIANGLLALHDFTHRCQVIVSCLFESWTCLTSLGLQSVADRYLPPYKLARLKTGTQVESLVATRLRAAFAQTGMQPPYPTWPFPPAELGKLQFAFPRAVLQKCREHLEKCIDAGVVTLYSGEDQGSGEIEEVVVEPVSSKERQMDEAAKNARLDRLKIIDDRYRRELAGKGTGIPGHPDHGEEFLGRALWYFTQAFRSAQGSLAEANLNIGGSEQYADNKYPLHARLQYEAMDENVADRELFLRAFARPHHNAFLAALGSARTLSGVKPDLQCRRLVLVDLVKNRRGAKTQEELKKILASGGFRIVPTEKEVRQLTALARTAEAFPNEWEEWAAHSKPLEQSGFLGSHLEWLLGKPAAGAGQQQTARPFPPDKPTAEFATPARSNVNPEKATALPAGKAEDNANEHPAAASRNGADVSLRIPVGGKLMSSSVTGEASLALETFKQHIGIFAGSGSGKTVLMKRMIEEAALCGVPSVVVDCGNDLARLGQPWPEKPEGWTEEDQRKADRYFRQVDVKVWTPGASEGNPLSFRKIPDLSAYADNADELQEAVTASMSALRGLIPMRDRAREGVVAHCLRWMAQNGGGDLHTLAQILGELPDDCEAHSINPAKAPTWALDMSSQLLGALSTNPQLGAAATTDISTLLSGRDGKTRISVINLAALGGKQSEQIFVNELAMALFDWIKRHPAGGVQGLFVLDEAKDFAPAQGDTPCRGSLERFGSQARKYGMGFVMATQEPRSVYNKIVSNCNTQFLGRQNSAADIATADDLLQKRGAVGMLERGMFFLKSVEFSGTPFRIAAKWCLSNHPPAPPDRDEVLRLAKENQ